MNAFILEKIKEELIKLKGINRLEVLNKDGDLKIFLVLNLNDNDKIILIEVIGHGTDLRSLQIFKPLDLNKEELIKFNEIFLISNKILKAILIPNFKVVNRIENAYSVLYCGFRLENDLYINFFYNLNGQLIFSLNNKEEKLEGDDLKSFLILNNLKESDIIKMISNKLNRLIFSYTTQEI